MKISVSLEEEDVEFLDAYAKARGIASRSAAVTRAIRSLKSAELSEDYAQAWQEWSKSEEEAWEVTASDGINP